LEAQLDLVFRNLAATLAAAGTDFGAVARLTLYVRGYDPTQLPAIRAIRDRYVDASKPPASALIGVAALFDDRALVEVDALALAPPIH
jgi:enamine deaminase RidA (YjgF/YER057c/UK114 family)